MTLPLSLPKWTSRARARTAGASAESSALTRITSYLGESKRLRDRVGGQARLPRRPQLRVALPLFDELFVGCHLDGAPVLHHDDAVGALGRREAVRDRDDRSARGARCERALAPGPGR